MQYFGLNIVEGAADSWMEAGMSWAEVEMSWVEVDGAGWMYVHGLVIPKNELNYDILDFAKSFFLKKQKLQLRIMC